MNIEFKALIPIHIYPNKMYGKVDAQIESLMDLAKLKPICYSNFLGDLQMQINYLGSEDNMPTYGLPLEYKTGISQAITCHLVEFCSFKEVDENDLTTYLDDISCKDRVEVAKRFTSYDISRFVSNFFIIANLARPGLLPALEGGVFADGAICGEIESNFSDLLNAYENCKKKGWPPVNMCSISKSWEWCNRIPGFSEGLGETPCGRTLAAFSYIFKSNIALNTNMDLVWALLGLEAIYCKGNIGLQNQLREKIEAFLGRRLENKKAIDQMYAFRSRFIHGDISFPFQYTYHDEYPKYEDKRDSATAEAIGLLISTLQKMIDMDIYELNFEYIYSEK